MMRPVGEADTSESVQGALAPGLAVDAGIDHRQFDIAERIECAAAG